MYAHMTACERIGIAGGCGLDCPVFLDGECSAGHEFLIKEDTDEDTIDLIEMYLMTDLDNRTKELKTEQVKGGNMEAPFKIDEEFIARLLLGYYNGDDSLKNPIKMFYENEALSDAIFRMVDSDLNSHAKHKMFALDLYLNGFGDVLNYKRVLPFTLKSVLNNDVRGINQSLINGMIQNFKEADLTMEQFEYFGINFDILFQEKTLDKDYKACKAMVLHKDFPGELLLEIYEETGDETFLPEAAKDIFIF